MRCVWLAACTIATAWLSGCSEPKAPEPEPMFESKPRQAGWVLPNTFVHEIPSPTAGRTYELWVEVPEMCSGIGKPCPIVFVTDANYAFPLVRSIRNRLGARGQNIEDFLLVGLAYAIGDSAATSRNRDYTPTDPLVNADARSEDYSGDAYGGAAGYRDYIEQHVFPVIAQHYRADMARKVYVGHSYGGLFGAYVLLTKPQLFDFYILSSPSLWFDDKAVFKLEEAYAADHTDLAAKVALFTGEYEAVKPGKPRFNTRHDVLADAEAFTQILRERGYKNVVVTNEVIADEDHLSVFPAALSRGLVWALPGFGPYTGG